MSLMVFRAKGGGGGIDWERGGGKRGSKQVRSARTARQRPNIKLENGLPVTTEKEQEPAQLAEPASPT